jgi:hypothetical protein
MLIFFFLATTIISESDFSGTYSQPFNPSGEEGQIYVYFNLTENNRAKRSKKREA